MIDLKRLDLIVIGTGAAASAAAFTCREAGWSVAVIDSRPFGGTCELRGCDPKKVLVGVGNLIDAMRRMNGKGLRSETARIDWAELMRFKRTFTRPVPNNREKGFQEAGISTFHGVAQFTKPNTIQVGQDTLEARHVLIATGAKPQRLNIPGEHLLTTSEQFLELDSLPSRIIFIGGGYISFEFAHLCARVGAEVTILHRSERPLENFDPDLVDRLVRKTRQLGINVELQSGATRIEHNGNFVVRASTPRGDREFKADLVVHGAGRVADLEELNLEIANVRADGRGVKVNDFLQSVSNPKVYAAGDAADLGMAKLTPVASYSGAIAAANLLKQEQRKIENVPVPTVTFTVPPLAAIGINEDAAKMRGLRYRVHQEDTGNWYSSKRVAEECSGFKVLIDEDSDQILGAHLLGPEADELVNLFALAMQAKVPATSLRDGIFAYPTHASDVHYML
jgi:glutathione reductase (NADPH)